MNKSGYDMSSEEIADEIQSNGAKENIPYYASMIEEYADKLMDAQLQALKEEVGKIDSYIVEDGKTYVDAEKILNLITNLEDNGKNK